MPRKKGKQVKAKQLGGQELPICDNGESINNVAAYFQHISSGYEDFLIFLGVSINVLSGHEAIGGIAASFEFRTFREGLQQIKQIISKIASMYSEIASMYSNMISITTSNRDTLEQNISQIGNEFRNRLPRLQELLALKDDNISELLVAFSRIRSDPIIWELDINDIYEILKEFYDIMRTFDAHTSIDVSRLSDENFSQAKAIGTKLCDVRKELIALVDSKLPTKNEDYSIEIGPGPASLLDEFAFDDSINEINESSFEFLQFTHIDNPKELPNSVSVEGSLGISENTENILDNAFAQSQNRPEGMPLYNELDDEEDDLPEFPQDIDQARMQLYEDELELSTSDSHTNGEEELLELSTSDSHTNGEDELLELSTSDSHINGEEELLELSTSDSHTNGEDELLELSTSDSYTNGEEEGNGADLSESSQEHDDGQVYYIPQNFEDDLPVDVLRYFREDPKESRIETLSQFSPFIGTLDDLSPDRLMDDDTLMERISLNVDAVPYRRGLQDLLYAYRYLGLTDAVYSWVNTMEPADQHYTLKERFDDLTKSKHDAKILAFKALELIEDYPVLYGIGDIGSCTVQMNFNRIVLTVVMQSEVDEAKSLEIEILKLWIEASVIAMRCQMVDSGKTLSSIATMNKVIILIGRLRTSDYRYIENDLVNKASIYINVRKMDYIVIERKECDQEILIDCFHMCLLAVRYLEVESLRAKTQNSMFQMNFTRQLRCVVYGTLIEFSKYVLPSEKLKLSYDIVDIAKNERMIDCILSHQIECPMDEFFGSIAPKFESSDADIVELLRVVHDNLTDYASSNMPPCVQYFTGGYINRCNEITEQIKEKLENIIYHAKQFSKRIFANTENTENTENTKNYNSFVSLIKCQKDDALKLVEHVKTLVTGHYSSIKDKINAQYLASGNTLSIEAGAGRKSETFIEPLRIEQALARLQEDTSTWEQLDKRALEQLEQAKEREKVTFDELRAQNNMLANIRRDKINKNAEEYINIAAELVELDGATYPFCASEKGFCVKIDSTAEEYKSYSFN